MSPPKQRPHVCSCKCAPCLNAAVGASCKTVSYNTCTSKACWRRLRSMPWCMLSRMLYAAAKSAPCPAIRRPSAVEHACAMVCLAHMCENGTCPLRAPTTPKSASFEHHCASDNPHHHALPVDGSYSARMTGATQAPTGTCMVPHGATWWLLTSCWRWRSSRASTHSGKLPPLPGCAG